jgi:hypothetical protein
VDQTWKHELIGSAAFLASSMKMPLTAIVLIFEFTRVGHDFLIPISLAVIPPHHDFCQGKSFAILTAPSLQAIRRGELPNWRT